MTVQFPGQPPWQSAPVPKPWRDWLSAFINWVTSRGTGSVSSVGLTMPGSFTVSGSPVTGSGTIAVAWNGTAPTVSSVALSLPAIFTVSGSPVTTTGTLTGTLATQSANLVWAGPTTGVAAAPTFRSLVAADIPSLSSTYLPLAGGTMAGTITMGGNLITNPKITTVRETAGTSSFSAGTLTLDLSTGTNFAVTLTANVTTITISNVPSTGQYVPIVVEFSQDATGGRTVTGWPSGTKWPGGAAPTITATANAVDVISGYTRDGGTTYRFARAHTDSK